MNIYLVSFSKKTESVQWTKNKVNMIYEEAK